MCDMQRIWKYAKCLEAQSNVYFFLLCGTKPFCGGLCLAALDFRFAGLRIWVSFGFVKICCNLWYRNNIFIKRFGQDLHPL